MTNLLKLVCIIISISMLSGCLDKKPKSFSEEIKGALKTGITDIPSFIGLEKSDNYHSN